LWTQVAAVAVAIVFVLAAGPTAAGQEKQDLAQLVAQVDPSVVTIAVSERSLGSGFVVDAQGLVLTNYHVIEGAKEATVIFPDKTRVKVDGFVGILPKKDLAVLRIQPAGKRLQALRIAEQAPAKGDKVYAFGAPMGLSGSVSDGIVAALRPGQEVRDTLKELINRDIYTDLLGYDLDAQWLQTTAPISPGNSGGPLVNGRGEVVGINTWVHALGQNLNFALSAVHVKPMMAGSGTTLHPLTDLPAPRKNIEQSTKGDPKKTLAHWNKLNELRVDLTNKIAAHEAKVQESPAPTGRPVRVSQGLRNKMATAFKERATAYANHASEIRILELDDIDTQLAVYSIAEANLAQRVADQYQSLAAAVAANSFVNISTGETKLKWLGQDILRFRTDLDVLRLVLAKRHGLKFPAFEAALKEAAASEDGGTEKEEADGPVDRSVPRLWTDRTGQFQIRAKYAGTEDGKVKLEKADGTVIPVPLERLSDKDQKFLGADKRIE
jgi:hypothetical protein